MSRWRSGIFRLRGGGLRFACPIRLQTWERFHALIPTTISEEDTRPGSQRTCGARHNTIIAIFCGTTVAPEIHMTTRALILTCICTSIFAVAMMISAHRSSHASAAPPHAEPAPVVVPAGTIVHVRLLQSISDDTKAGDIIQGFVANPVLVNSQIVIPVNTRALTKVIEIQPRKGGVADVSIELNGLIFKDRNIRIPGNTVTKAMKPLSDIDVLARGFFGILDGAIGAAGSASVGRSPNAGAATAGRLSAGAQQDIPELLVFTTAEPLDLTTASR